MSGLLKIGFSARPVQERVAELSSTTGVPDRFELEAYFLSVDPVADEQQIHARLGAHRVNGKEFFELSISEALKVAESVCKRPPAYLNPRNASNLKSNRRVHPLDRDVDSSKREKKLADWQQRRYKE